MRLLVWLLEQGPFVDWVRDERLPLVLILIPPLVTTSSPNIPLITNISLLISFTMHASLFIIAV